MHFTCRGAAMRVYALILLSADDQLGRRFILQTNLGKT
jgi:hypothetical protein